jgi:Zn-dependent protease with chaperone function
MTLEYSGRLLCLCLATFFLVHLAAGMLVLAFAARAVKMAERTTARTASRLLLVLRMLPPVSAIFVVVTLCIPSYLWLEPEMAGEDAGFVCLAASFLGLVIWGISTVRAVRAAARSARYISRCQSNASSATFEAADEPVWVMEGATGSLMLTGILRPRLFISRKVMTVLSREQLAAALNHESAHRISWDNLKRLLMVVTPGILPFYRGFDVLEGHWGRLTEWAADDYAVQGDTARSLSLAAALVRVARLSPAPHSSPLVTSLLNEGRDLEARVNRLLRDVPMAQPSPRGFPIAASAALAMTVIVVGLMARPSTLQSVHQILEGLIR